MHPVDVEFSQTRATRVIRASMRQLSFAESFGDALDFLFMVTLTCLQYILLIQTCPPTD